MLAILMSDAFDPTLPGRLAPFGEVFTDPARLAEADVVLIRSKTKATQEFIDRAPRLKLIIRGGVGLDNVDAAAAAARGIVVRNTPEASSVAVAELAFALMIALPNHLTLAHHSMKEGKWLKKDIKRTELMGKTLGILGVGRIGRELAQRARAFGMKVVGHARRTFSEPDIEQVPLDELYARCDYISLHTPLTPETRGMIHAGSIDKMKTGVRIVNTGRGACVVEADLVAALESGKVAGYATDVWYSDPPVDSPIVKAPNVLLAPHIGASTKENLLRIGDMIVDIIAAFAPKEG